MRPKSSHVRPLACNWCYCAQFIAKTKAACALRFSWAATSSNLGLGAKTTSSIKPEVQCVAWPTVTFPAAGHHRPLTEVLGDRGTCVWTTCPRLLPESGTAEIRTRDLLNHESSALTITPLRLTMTYECLINLTQMQNIVRLTSLLSIASYMISIQPLNVACNTTTIAASAP